MELFKNFKTELKVVHAIKWSMVVLFLFVSFVFGYQYRETSKVFDIIISIIFFLSSFISSLELVHKSKLTKINILYVIGFYLYAISITSHYLVSPVTSGIKPFSVITILISTVCIISVMIFKKKTLKITDYIFTNYNKMIDIQNELSKLSDAELEEFNKKITTILTKDIDNSDEQKQN